MRVRVLFFGMLKDLVERGHEDLSLPETATLQDVLGHYGGRFPRLSAMYSSIAMSINQEYAGPDSRLKDGDEVALLPPVSGGSQAAPSAGRFAAIVRHAIDTEALVSKLKHSCDGAVVVFEGIVRDNTRGRRTLFLDYEAYEEMALKQMEALAEQARAQFSVREVALVHRIGRLEIGETSVAIAVASAHRGAAFEACRWVIDTLKRTVPIWKKEYFEDGAVWADGEPFPKEVVQSSRSGEPASK